MLCGTLSRLGRLAQRFFGFIINPAQLPGDPTKLLQDLVTTPLKTIRSWSPKLVKQLIWQILAHEKLTLPNDPLLEQMDNARTRFINKGWAAWIVTTRDGVELNCCLKEPTERDIPDGQRYIIFIGGNMQIYEFWLAPYFEPYARDSRLGFLAFNFRGVGRSEGAVTCVDDMLLDIGACVESLVMRRGVKPEHILIHGFSIGGALAALYLASPLAMPGVCMTSDRSFRTFAHAAFSIVRGFGAAVGEPHRSFVAGSDGNEDEGEDAGENLEDSGDGDDGDDGVGPRPPRRWCARQLHSFFIWVELLARVLIAQLAVYLFKATCWELDAEEAWASWLIQGRKVLVYNRADNIVCYAAASLHNALVQQPALLEDVAVIEVTLRDAGGWAMHDFPLYNDSRAWRALINAERKALGLPPFA